MIQRGLMWVRENMFNFKGWFKWPKEKISDEEYEYLSKVCDIQRSDTIPQALKKIVTVLKRLRGEEI